MKVDEFCDISPWLTIGEFFPEDQVPRTYADTLETENFTFFGYGGSTGYNFNLSYIVKERKKLVGRLPIDGHRRKLVLKSQDEKNSSLVDRIQGFPR